jgi:hypothetical protein
LPMAALGLYSIPAIGFDEFDVFPDFHQNSSPDLRAGLASQHFSMHLPNCQFQVQCQHRREDVFVAHVGLPAVGGEDGGVELLVGEH